MASEWDSVQQIIQRYPGHAAKAKHFGYIESGTPFHQALHEHYEHEMPYDMAKGKIGDPDGWVEERLEDIGFFDNPITRGY
tara:strand:- start:251 stop:493 length:243 start_codon:yes stop_codon:yes gene_type:complete